ncbi:hypothetical protein V6N13_011258 [Hibiscus sabdariffa]
MLTPVQVLSRGGFASDAPINDCFNFRTFFSKKRLIVLIEVESCSGPCSGGNGIHGKLVGGHAKVVSLTGTQDCVYPPKQVDYSKSISLIPLHYVEPYFGGVATTASGSQAMKNIKQESRILYAGIKVGVYCPVGKSDEGKFALEVAVKSLEIFTRYFSMPYPVPKLDMVAVPEFFGGAMENYGLIIYRENKMLHNDLRSTAAKKQRLTIVVAHEVAHQWFGNLVTMEWWTHLWLNEGFATWISYMATDMMFPEWKIWTQFLQETNGGLRLDAQEQSHPIEVKIQHAHEVDEAFDAIGYKKGSAVIRMLQGYIGDEIFQKSLSLYMKRYAWSNASTEDLWSALSEVSGIRVNSMMDGWTKQKGYPVISVKSKGHILEFQQSQFLLSGSRGDGQWMVPITLCLGSYERRKSFLLESRTENLDTSDLLPTSGEKNEDEYGEASWIKVNVEQSGFYRVKYGDELNALLRKAIEKGFLSATDKFGILDDRYALCVACEQSLSSLLSLMDVYKKETDYIVLSKLIDVCYAVLEVLRDAIPDLTNALKEFFINILLFSAE